MKWWALRMLLMQVLDMQSDSPHCCACSGATLHPPSFLNKGSVSCPSWCWMQPGSESAGSLGSLISWSIKIMKWHEMKVWLNTYQNPQAGLIGRVTGLMPVSAFSFHAKSSSVAVCWQWEIEHTVKSCLATSWCWFEKINTDLNSCFCLFSSQWLEKQNLLWEVASGCTGPAENSKNLDKLLVFRISPPAVMASPAVGRERREKPHSSHQNISSSYLPEPITLFFWPKKMRGVSPWKLAWNKKPLDTMQPDITGHSLQAKLKQIGLNQSNTSCDYSSLCSNKSWRYCQWFVWEWGWRGELMLQLLLPVIAIYSAVKPQWMC